MVRTKSPSTDDGKTAIQVIQRDETMDGAQKREEIDRLKQLIGDLAKQAEDVRKSLRQ